MKQFGKILKFELKYYLKNKVFVGVTLFLVLASAIVMFFPRFAELFKNSEVTESVDEKAVMLVKMDSQEQADMITTAFATAFSDYDVKHTQESDDFIREQIASGGAECAFVVRDLTEYTYYVNNLSLYDVNTQIADQVLQNMYQLNAMLGSGMTAEQAGAVMSVQIRGSIERLGVDQMENYWYTYIMIFALYMVILLYGQMVATNVATEKSSRAMELLITSAKPTSMMFGKVLASCLAGFAQLVAIFGSSVLFHHLNKAQRYYRKDKLCRVHLATTILDLQILCFLKRNSQHLFCHLPTSQVCPTHLTTSICTMFQQALLLQDLN